MTTTVDRSDRTPTWLVATVAGLFGLFYAYAVWSGVGLLISPSPERTAIGWAVLAFVTVFPILVFAAAFALGYRRSPAAFSLILLTGLGLVAVFLQNVLAYALTSGVV